MLTLTDHERHVLLARDANRFDDMPSSKMTLPKWSAKDATLYSCGSAGCACGWAATWHTKLGWQFNAEICPDAVPVYENRIGHDAYALFFALPEDEAESITSPTHYISEFGTHNPTPQQVAKRIRDVLRTVDPQALIEAESIPTEYSGVPTQEVSCVY